MNVTPRQLLILHAIIDDYIFDRNPVGSRTLAKRPDLPRLCHHPQRDGGPGGRGYLEQPHTSAGLALPDKAYRLYVDTLMRVSSLQDEEIS